MMTPDDEKDILARCSCGDSDSFAILYNRYWNPLCRYLNLFTGSKSASEEIVQEIFFKIWEKKENLVHVASFQSYLFKAAKNLLIDQVRRKRTEEKILESIRLFTKDGQEYSDSEIIYEQCFKIAQDAKNLLPSKKKTIFEMSCEENRSMDEIAQSLAMPKMTVKKQLYAAKTFIRKYLSKQGVIISLMVIFLFVN